jgi:parvulin-like peptidyl-prolyl isomerase
MKRTIRYMAFLCCLALGASTVKAAVADKVIAVVNDEVITQREFNRVLEPIKTAYGQRFKGEELSRRLEQAKKGLMAQLINTKVAISYAKQQDMEVDPEEVQSRVDKVKEYYGSEEEFLKALKAKGTNYTEFREDIRDQLMAQKVVEKEVASTIVITPGDIRDLYEKNKEALIAPDAVKVRTITVKKKEEGDDPEAKKKIKDIAAKIDNGGSFSEVAEEMSEGPFAERGGDMGYIVQGQTLPEIESVIFSLDKGEMSDIVETRVGYHVFMVEDTRESKQMELSEVSEFLREQLYKRRFQEALQRWMEEKKKNAYISFK